MTASEFRAFADELLDLVEDIAVTLPSNPPTPPPPIPAAPASAGAPAPVWYWNTVDPRIPAHLCITAYHQNPREALGAAYLLAQQFCDYAQVELRKPQA